MIQCIERLACLVHVSWEKRITVKRPLKRVHASSPNAATVITACVSVQFTADKEMEAVVGWWIPMTDVKSSGAELPAAMKVAPATSSLRWRRYEKNW